jgi:hypothetical protein
MVHGNMQQKATNNIQKKPPITRPKPIIERNITNAHMSFSLTHTTLLIKVTIHQTRANIEAKVKAHVETFKVENSCELLTPPPKVKMRGLYILLSKTNTIMNKIILKAPKETKSLSMKMETNGTLRNTLVTAFGQWYLFPPISTFFVLEFFFLMCVHVLFQ